MSNRAWSARPFVFSLCLPLIASCAADATESPLSMRVTWGIERTTTLPPTVTNVEVVTCVNAGQSDEECTSSTCSVSAITLMSDVPTCRPSTGTEMYMDDPVLVRTGLPTGTPLSFELHGKNESDQVLYVGRAGPFVLGEGQRRYVELHMYTVGRSEIVSGTSINRFLHTATRLPDGRVLIAGGFTSAMPMAACPDALALPPETRCFDLVATDEAIAFEPSTGRTTPIRSAMLDARAGHTATALPDGRVLIAGGAPRAVLAMVAQGVAAVGGYRLELFPQLEDGTDGALDTFEVFDAYLDRADDPDRNGDPGAGRFLGEAGQRSPAALNQPRFMHAAAQVPDSPNLVVLAGGLGGPDSAGTWEVFDNDRAGGYGVYAGPDNRLPTARSMPSAIGIGSRVWIVGGALAADNSQIADVWSADAMDPNGTISTATAAGDGYQFPNSVPDAGELHPEYALVRPSVAAVSGGTRPLVIGWYGPQCEPGMSTPTFASPDVTTEYCNSPAAPETRSFTVSDASGITAPTTVKSRSFGAVAEIACFRPAETTHYFAVTGGIANAIWTPQASIDFFTGEIDGDGAAQRALDVSVMLAAPRFFHTSTGLGGLGIVTIGGISFSSSLDRVIFQTPIEVVYVASPDYLEC